MIFFVVGVIPEDAIRLILPAIVITINLAIANDILLATIRGETSLIHPALTPPTYLPFNLSYRTFDRTTHRIQRLPIKPTPTPIHLTHPLLPPNHHPFPPHPSHLHAVYHRPPPISTIEGVFG